MKIMQTGKVLNAHQLIAYLRDFAQPHVSIQSKITNYHFLLTQAHHVYGNLAYHALRNHTIKDQIINHYLTAIFEKQGIQFDRTLKEQLMSHLFQADIHERLYQEGASLNLEIIKQLHVNIFEKYAGLPKEAWKDSIFMTSAGNALWTSTTPILNKSHLQAKTFNERINQQMILKTDLKNTMSEYMQFIESAFYTDKILQDVLLKIPYDEITEFLMQLKNDITRYPVLRNEWESLNDRYNEYHYPSLFSQIWKECIELSQDRALSIKEGMHFAPCDTIYRLESLSQISQTIKGPKKNTIKEGADKPQEMLDTETVLYTIYSLQTSSTLDHLNTEATSASHSGYISNAPFLFHTTASKLESIASTPIPSTASATHTYSYNLYDGFLPTINR
jgi:hypothetical protein